MSISRRIYFLIFSLLFSFIICEPSSSVSSNEVECDPAYPHFSAGDLNLTKDNYEEFKKQNKVFLLGLSDSECTKCCYMERMISKLKELLETEFKYKGKKIPVARIDIKTARGSFAKDLPNFNYYPKILLYKDGSYYSYMNYLHYPLILYFINRVLYPTLVLNTTEEVNKFLDTTREHPDPSEFYKYGAHYIEISKENMPNRLNRAIAFVTSKSDYKEDVKKISDAAQRLAARDDLRIAFVYNKDTIKDIKKKHPNWFSEFSSTSLIIQRSPGDVTKFDLSTESTEYYYWFTEKSLKSVDEFNRDTIRVYEHCITPIFILLMDMIPSKQKQTDNLLSLLNRSAKKSTDFILYAYANATDDFIKSRKFAIENIPGAILTFRDGATIPYPKNWAFDDANMDKFFELYLRQKLNKTEIETQQPDYEKHIYQDLNAVKILRYENFNDTVLDFGKYVLVFFFESSSEDLEYFSYYLEKKTIKISRCNKSNSRNNP